MTKQARCKPASTEVWPKVPQLTQVVGVDLLSDQEAQAIWDEGAAFIDRKSKMFDLASKLRTTLNEQIRARPHQFELNQMRVELDAATPRISPTASHDQQRRQLEVFFDVVDAISQRYADLSANYLPFPVPEDDIPVTKELVVQMMLDAGWQGNVTAFLSQASVDPEIKACQGPGGRNWIPRKVYDLGLKRGKLQPTGTLQHQISANNPWGT